MSKHEPGPSTGGFQVLTSTGPAAIAVVRVRGAAVGRFVERHLHFRGPRSAQTWSCGQVLRAELRDSDGGVIDDILVSVHGLPPAWDLRLHLHGNPWLVKRCAQLAQACGLAALEEAQTTLWETADALEAEAFALLPALLTRSGARWLLNQVTTLYETTTLLLASESIDRARRQCRAMAARAELVTWFTRPLRVVLAGPPNSGKSTLTNALADQAVSVVAPTPGTTRDWVEVPGEVDGFPVLWIDTAGLREGAEGIEVASAERTQQCVAEADAVLIVLDADDPAAQRAFVERYPNLKPACVVLNKRDLLRAASPPTSALPAEWRPRAVPASATQRSGLSAIGEELMAAVNRTPAALASPAAFTQRQVSLLMLAAGAHDYKTMRANLLQLLSGAHPE